MTIIRGTEHIHDSVKYGQELLAFIEREPLMQWLIERVEKVSRKIKCDGCLGDYHSDAYVVLATAPFGKDEKGRTELVQVAGLVFQYSSYQSDAEGIGWYIRGDGKEYPLETFIGELDINRIRLALKLSAHDVAEATRKMAVKSSKKESAA